MSYISGLLNQSVTIAEPASITDGDITYATGVQYPARVEYRPRRVLNQQGAEVTSVATVYVEVSVGINAQITLPDGTVRTPIEVQRCFDRFGKFGHSEVAV